MRVLEAIKIHMRWVLCSPSRRPPSKIVCPTRRRFGNLRTAGESRAAAATGRRNTYRAGGGGGGGLKVARRFRMKNSFIFNSYGRAIITRRDVVGWGKTIKCQTHKSNTCGYNTFSSFRSVITRVRRASYILYFNRLSLTVFGRAILRSRWGGDGGSRSRANSRHSLWRRLVRARHVTAGGETRKRKTDGTTIRVNAIWTDWKLDETLRSGPSVRRIIDAGRLRPLSI